MTCERSITRTCCGGAAGSRCSQASNAGITIKSRWMETLMASPLIRFGPMNRFSAIDP